jgi:hypothetical protein
MWADGAEESGDKSKMPEWRGKVQRVVNGETYPFDDWSGLVDVLTAMLAGTNVKGRSRDLQPEKRR